MNETEGSIAPKERINIRYVPATMGQIAEAELPLKLVVLGDFLGKADTTPVEERRMINVDKNTLSTVMSQSEIERKITVRNALDEHNGSTELRVNLKFESFKDFEPDSLVQQVPELLKMMQLREALVALKGPLGNMPAFRKRMQQILENEESRNRLIAELEALHQGDSKES